MSETEKPHPTPDDVPGSPGELTEDDDEREGPDVDELDEDPAYNPDDEGLRGIKGG